MKFPSRLVLISLLLLPLSEEARGQGSLSPPGAAAPSMKSLDQIEARIPIGSAPYTITGAGRGSYYLTGNLTVTSGDAIIILASDVTLDLNGYTISSSNPTPAGSAISIGNTVSNVTIRNGHIRGGVTVDINGTFTGPGFANGIRSGFGNLNTHISNIVVQGVMGNGIQIGIFNGVVENCSVVVASGTGIQAGMVYNCTALNCGTGISCDQAQNSRGGAVTTGTGMLVARTATHCIGESVGGKGLVARIANGCEGTSVSEIGLQAEIAETSFGTSASGKGLDVKFLANNSRGVSDSGVGLTAQSASNCSGTSKTSFGISATTTTNCVGASTSSRGIFTVNATNCVATNDAPNEASISAIGTINSCLGQNTGGGQALNAALAIGSINNLGSRQITKDYLAP